MKKIISVCFLIYFSCCLLQPAKSFSLDQNGFVENKGQVKGYDQLPHPEVKYTFKKENLHVFFLKTGIAYQFTQVHYPAGYNVYAETEEDYTEQQQLSKQIRTETYRVNMLLIGIDSNATITTEGRSDDYYNYYNHDVMDVHTYSKLIYHNIYPGIDWVIYQTENGIKYDFVVQPYADPNMIKWKFEYSEGITLNKEGNIIVNTRMGSIIENAPISFQGNKQIKTTFIFGRNNELSFQIGDYNNNEKLIIDPNVIWATYYGGEEGDAVLSNSTDPLGNVYIGGVTNSSSAIASGGYQNNYAGGNGVAFLVKFNSSGVRQWGTYYGGTSYQDYGTATATDGVGNIYLAGYTYNSSGIASGGHQNTFTGTAGAYTEGFLVKFNSNGVRQWATYYGGSGNEFISNDGLATDGSGNIYLSGYTGSSNNIASGGFQNTRSGTAHDAFLAKFNTNGVRQWATYYGNTNDERVGAVATDGSGNVYLAGLTLSTSGISSGGHQNTFGGGTSDAFLVKFNSSGARQWATYYGGSGNDMGYSVTTDATENVYLAGVTNSTSAISFGGHQNVYGGSTSGNTSVGDFFLAKFNSSGARQWATYYGGSEGEGGFVATATDVANNVYLSSYTFSSNNIAFNGYQNQLLGYQNGFLVKFNSNGERKWGTYYGGGSEQNIFISTDLYSNIYMSGSTYSTENIAINGHQNSLGGNSDGFLVKFDTLANPIQNNSVSGSQSICSNHMPTMIIGNTPSGGTGSYQYLWLSSIISASNGFEVAAGINNQQNYNSGALPVTTWFKRVVISGLQSDTSDAYQIIINPLPSTIASSSGYSFCTGSSVIINSPNEANISYNWLNDNYSVIGAGQQYEASSGGAYYLVATNSITGCTDTSDAIIITEYQLPHAAISSSDIDNIICIGSSAELTANGGINYSWDNGLGEGQIKTVSPTGETTYTVTVTDSNSCVVQVSYILDVVPNPTIGISPLDATVCYGNSINLMAFGADSYEWDNGLGTGNSKTVTPYTSTTYSVTGVENTYGCSSTTSQIVTVLLTYNTDDSESICSGNFLTFGSQTLTESGQYYETFTALNGCDSLVTLGLIVSDVITVVEKDTICQGQSYQLPDGSFTSNGGSYSFAYPTASGCDSTFIVELFVDICTGLRQVDLQSIIIFPNPNNGEFIIEVYPPDDYILKIFNTTGQIIYETKNARRFDANLYNISAGIYNVQINSKNGINNKLLIIH